MHVTATQRFTAYGPSHWAVLAVFLFGAALLVVVGRRHRRTPAARHVSRGFAAALLALQLGALTYTLLSTEWTLADSVPLHLSDLAPFAAAYALWSHARWAYALTYYWCLSLSTQALISPVFVGPDRSEERRVGKEGRS